MKHLCSACATEATVTRFEKPDRTTGMLYSLDFACECPSKYPNAFIVSLTKDIKVSGPLSDSLHVAYAATKIETGEVFFVPRPGRHCHVLWLLNVEGRKDRDESKDIQGFVLSDGHFVGRATAAMVASNANQLIKSELERRGLNPDLVPDILFSEDVW